MKKILVSAVLALCLIGGWAVTALGFLGRDDTAARVQAYRAKAQEQMALGGYGMAKDCYEAMIRLEDTAENRLEQIEAYRTAGLTSDYKKAAGALLARYPEDFRGYEELAGYYDGVGAYADCVEVVQKASAAGVLTDALRELYYNNAFRFTYLRGSYDSISPMKNGTGLARSGENWGLLNSGGELIGGAVFQQAANFIDSYAAAKDEARSGYISRDGQWYLVLETPFDRAGSMSGGGSVVYRNGKAEVVNGSGTTCMGHFEDASGFANGVAAVKENGQWRLISASGETVGDGTYLDVKRDSDGLCSTAGVVFVQTQAGWQLVDTEGKPCSNLIFDQVEPFFDGTFAAACVQGKWGFVTTEGQWAAEPQFEGAGSFGRNMAPVKVDGLWGYLDKSLRVVIEPQFEEAGPFASCGVAPVKTEGTWRYIKLLV